MPRLLFFKTLYLDPVLPDFDPAIPDYRCPAGENHLLGGSPRGTAREEMTGNCGIAQKERKKSALGLPAMA
jgi:hypothetical protein